MSAALIVVPIPRVVEAVLWRPDTNGRLIGGWPHTRKWAAALGWKVSSLDLALHVENGAFGGIVAPWGYWILLHENGLFTESSPEAFVRDYVVPGA